MLIKTPQGYQVRSHKGRPLSKPDLSEAQGLARLAQVEMFKKMSEEGRKKKGKGPKKKGRRKKKTL